MLICTARFVFMIPSDTGVGLQSLQRYINMHYPTFLWKVVSVKEFCRKTAAAWSVIHSFSLFFFRCIFCHYVGGVACAVKNSYPISEPIDYSSATCCRQYRLLARTHSVGLVGTDVTVSTTSALITLPQGPKVSTLYLSPLLETVVAKSYILDVAPAITEPFLYHW